MNVIIYSLKRLAGRITRLIEIIILGLKGFKFLTKSKIEFS